MLYDKGQYIPNNITSQSTFDNIAGELQARFVLQHNGQRGGRDQAHNVLAMAIICSMWCGWLSQAKTKIKNMLIVLRRQYVMLLKLVRNIHRLGHELTCIND